MEILWGLLLLAAPVSAAAGGVAAPARARGAIAIVPALPAQNAGLGALLALPGFSGMGLSALRDPGAFGLIGEQSPALPPMLPAALPLAAAAHSAALRGEGFVLAAPGDGQPGQALGTSRERSLSALSELAVPAVEIALLPRQASSERTWQLGRRLWDVLSADAEVSEPLWTATDRPDAVAAPDWRAAGGAAFELIRDPEGRSARASAREPQARFRLRFTAPGSGSRDFLLNKTPTARPAAASAPLGQEVLTQPETSVPLLVLRVLGETLVLTERALIPAGTGPRALTLRAMASRPGFGAPQASPLSVSWRAAPKSFFAGATSPASAEAELWAALEAAAALPPPQPERDPAVRRESERLVPPAASSRRAQAPLPWALLLPLALAALRYRREFLS